MRRSDVKKLKYGQQVTVCEWRKGKPGVHRQTIIPDWRREYIGTVVKTTPNGGVLVKTADGQLRWEPYHAIVVNTCEIPERRLAG